MEVEAYTRESIEYDRPPQKVRGTLTTRWVAPLNYLQHLVNGIPINADTVRPIDTGNANPEGCNQYTGPGCGTGSHSEHHDSAMSLISTHLATAGLSKEIADHYSGSASAVIRNMSPLSAQRLSENTMSVKFFPDNASLSRVLAGRYEFVARLLQGGASVGGCYDGKLGQLLLDGSHVLGGKPLPTPGVYAHEFGHAIDGPKGARISDDPDWHSAWSAELKTGIISKYAGTSPSEGFAEVARILHGTNLKVDEIEKHIPKCMAVWRSYGLLDNMPGHKMTANESEIIENAEPLLDELFSEGVDADGVIVDVLLPDAEDA